MPETPVPPGDASLRHILLYGDIVLRSEHLTIPHPRMKERAFVLVPLLDISPELKDPLTNTPYRDYLDMLDDQGVNFFTTLEL